LTVRLGAPQAGHRRRFLHASRTRLKMPARCDRSRRALRNARRKRAASSALSSTRAHVLQMHCARRAAHVARSRGLSSSQALH